MMHKTEVDSQFKHDPIVFHEHSHNLESNNSNKINEKHVTNKQTDCWLTVEDYHLIKLILKTVGDDDKNRIITSVIDHPMTIVDIYEKCNIPQTSGYRKIRELIQDGFLVLGGYDTIPYGIKKVRKFVSIFKDITIQINKNKIVVQVQLTDRLDKNNNLHQMLRKNEESKTPSGITGINPVIEII